MEKQSANAKIVAKLMFRLLPVQVVLAAVTASDQTYVGERGDGLRRQMYTTLHSIIYKKPLTGKSVYYVSEGQS